MTLASFLLRLLPRLVYSFPIGVFRWREPPHLNNERQRGYHAFNGIPLHCLPDTPYTPFSCFLLHSRGFKDGQVCNAGGMHLRVQCLLTARLPSIVENYKITVGRRVRMPCLMDV
ncbi:hypothetical protein BJX65DRAFT_160298 [Aspergillus insuetus]